MAYRYYGGTQGRSVESMLADIKWAEKHNPKLLKKMANNDKFVATSILLICGFVVFGIIALVVWGINNLAESGSFTAIISNPLLLLVLFPFVMAGAAWAKCK